MDGTNREIEWAVVLRNLRLSRTSEVRIVHARPGDHISAAARDAISRKAEFFIFNDRLYKVTYDFGPVAGDSEDKNEVDAK